MNTLSLDTTQNISVQYPLAGVGDRILATLIDGLIIVGYIIIILFVFGVSLSTVGSGGHVQLLLFLFYIPCMFYNLVCEMTMQGQTFGKKAIGIRVMSLDGGSPNKGQYLIRWLFRLLDIYPASGLVALLCVAISEKSQRLGDMVAGTMVVKIKQDRQMENSVQNLESFTTAYQVRYPEMEQLTSSDIQLVKDTIMNVNKTGNTMVALELSNKIEQKTGVHRQEEPLAFLQIVYEDYLHLH